MNSLNRKHLRNVVVTMNRRLPRAVADTNIARKRTEVILDSFRFSSHCAPAGLDILRASRMISLPKKELFAPAKSTMSAGVPWPEILPIPRGWLSEKILAARLGENSSLDVPFHRGL